MHFRTPVLVFLASAGLGASTLTLVQPPLPPGSARVNVAPGQSKEESERMRRAHLHHHSYHYRKDFTDEAGTDGGDLLAPPLPPGSARVRIEPGQSREENEKMLRAHQHQIPFQSNKDYSHDDAVDGQVRPPTPKSK